MANMANMGEINLTVTLHGADEAKRTVEELYEAIEKARALAGDLAKECENIKISVDQYQGSR